jgi:hypothetical protein
MRRLATEPGRRERGSAPRLEAGEEEEEVVDVDGVVGRAGAGAVVEIDEHVARFEADEEGEEVVDGDRAVAREAVGKVAVVVEVGGAEVSPRMLPPCVL